jgi:hypothetical protein
MATATIPVHRDADGKRYVPPGHILVRSYYASGEHGVLCLGPYSPFATCEDFESIESGIDNSVRLLAQGEVMTVPMGRDGETFILRQNNLEVEKRANDDESEILGYIPVL